MASSNRLPSLTCLHSELLEEIFCRTGAEDLIESKTVCKQWNSLIEALTNGTNKKIIYKHLDQSSSDSSSKRFLRTVGDKVRIIDPVTKVRSTSSIPNEFQEPKKVDAILHCDGLVLCTRRDQSLISQPGRPEIAMWNPLLKKVKWINPSHFSYNSVYGIGYKSREKGYMILRFSNSWFKLLDVDKLVEVYEFENASWRTLDNVTADVLVDSSCKGVALMGNMYWLADKNRILGFDFTAEAFKDVCSCPPLSLGERCYLSCFCEDRLSLLLQQAGESKKIEVWLSNNLADESVSFTRYFTVASPALPALKLDTSRSHPVYCFVKPRSIYALCEGAEGYGVTFAAYGILYEIDEGGKRNQTETETERVYGRIWDPIFCGQVYVPSFVPLP